MWQLETGPREITACTARHSNPRPGRTAILAGILMIKAFTSTTAGWSAGHGDRPRFRAWHQPGHCALAGYKVVEIASSARAWSTWPRSKPISRPDCSPHAHKPHTLGAVRRGHPGDNPPGPCERSPIATTTARNLNAIMGKARPGDMGMDVVHIICIRPSPTPTVVAARGRSGRP